MTDLTDETKLIEILAMLAQKVKPSDIDLGEWEDSDEDEPDDPDYIQMEEEADGEEYPQ